MWKAKIESVMRSHQPSQGGLSSKLEADLASVEASLKQDNRDTAAALEGRIVTRTHSSKSVILSRELCGETPDLASLTKMPPKVNSDTRYNELATQHQAVQSALKAKDKRRRKAVKERR